MKDLKTYFQNNILSVSVPAIKRQFNLLQAVQSTDYETEQLMGYLKHRGEDWMTIWDGHAWHSVIKQSIKTLLRHDIPEGDLVFLFHLQSRWLLVGVDGAASFEVVPAIFLYTEHYRDGLAVSFYRILSGVSLSPLWMKTLVDLFKGVMSEKPKKAQIPYNPYVKLDLGTWTN